MTLLLAETVEGGTLTVQDYANAANKGLIIL